MILTNKYKSKENEKLLSKKKTKQKKENMKLRQKNAKLRQKLRKTKMKFLRLTNAMKNIHSIINSLQKRLLIA